MNRRDFVARFGGSIAAGGAVVATAAVASGHRAGAVAQDGLKFAQREFKAINDRLDRMDDSHKRLMRALIFVASLSTGMDVLNLLKGDLLS